MIKHYKNVSGRNLNVKLFGVGDVIVPLNALAVPLEEGTANAINQMVYPSKVLEEVDVNADSSSKPNTKRPKR